MKRATAATWQRSTRHRSRSFCAACEALSAEQHFRSYPSVMGTFGGLASNIKFRLDLRTFTLSTSFARKKLQIDGNVITLLWQQLSFSFHQTEYPHPPIACRLHQLSYQSSRRSFTFLLPNHPLRIPTMTYFVNMGSLCRMSALRFISEALISSPGRRIGAPRMDGGCIVLYALIIHNTLYYTYYLLTLLSIRLVVSTA